MNNYLRQQESEIKLINNDHLTFEFDGTWFRDPKTLNLTQKKLTCLVIINMEKTFSYLFLKKAYNLLSKLH